MTSGGNGGGAGESVVLAARDCFGGGYRHAPRNDVEGEALVPAAL